MLASAVVALALAGGKLPRPAVVTRPSPAASPALCGRLSAIGAALALGAGAAHAEQETAWTYSQFLDAVDANKVEKASFSSDGKVVTSIDTSGNRHSTKIFPDKSAELVQSLQKHNVLFAVQAQPEPGLAAGLGAVFGSLAFPLLFLAGIILINRSAGGMGPGGDRLLDIGKSQTDVELEPNTGVTFEDVAGCDASKLELSEVVEFLKNPSKFSALGAKIPRGVIMEGPPGTGKTLLARAVAGEAGVPFVSATGSQFVEMFVGVGASRVRDLFGKAKKNAPCIIFIDELDAIGRARAGSSRGGMGGGGGSDERESTLNQILTEMDGFEGNTGIIILAATNRADVLDPALLRPGRFDRRVPVDLPDVSGRLSILKVHAKGKPLGPTASLEKTAKRTIGFSGASLANLMNEAAIVAARRSKTEISADEIDYAIDRIQVGMQKDTGTSFPNRQRLVAYHEAGHALLGLLTPGYDAVTKVTIIPRTNGAGGFTLFTPSEERLETGMYSKKYLEGQLVVALGGRVAEEIVYGPSGVTTGASNDLQQVRSIARRMVTQWGYAKDKDGLTLVAWEPPEGNNDYAGAAASPETEKEIDAAVKGLVTTAYATAKQTIADNRALLDGITDALIAEETVDQDGLLALVDKHAPGKAPIARANAPAPEVELNPPPPPPPSPPAADAAAEQAVAAANEAAAAAEAAKAAAAAAEAEAAAAEAEAESGEVKLPGFLGGLFGEKKDD